MNHKTLIFNNAGQDATVHIQNSTEKSFLGRAVVFHQKIIHYG
jgi:hypothetical protein